LRAGAFIAVLLLLMLELVVVDVVVTLRQAGVEVIHGSERWFQGWLASWTSARGV
jgi:hypothetical protein